MMMNPRMVVMAIMLCLPCLMTTALVTPTTSVSLASSSSSAVKSKATKAVQSLSTSSKQKGLSMTASVADDSGASAKGGNDGASVTQLIFNLVKNIVGAGVLSLPVGIAAWGNAPSAIIPATALIAIIGGLSGYGFALIGRCCAYTNTKSYRDAWSATISQKTSWVPASIVTFKTICAILAYSMILGDTFISLLSTAGIAATKIPVTLILTSTILLPLCLLKNLSSLAPFSLIGSLGMLYTAIAMVIRYVGKSYAVGGKFAMDVAPALRPSFGTVGAKGILNPSAGILVGMLSTAYMAHFNAPKFYNELKDKTLPRYYTVVGTSFAVSIAMFALMACVGFLTFGSGCSGLILNNYSNKDTLMSISRIAVAVSLVFSYPLAFTGARDGVMDLLKLDTSVKTQNALTVAILSLVTVLALIIPDVSFVLSFAGATLGNALIYVFPALMFRGAIKQKGDSATKGQKREVIFALGSALSGILMGAVGATMAVQGLRK